MFREVEIRSARDCKIALTLAFCARDLTHSRVLNARRAQIAGESAILQSRTRSRLQFEHVRPSEHAQNAGESAIDSDSARQVRRLASEAR